MKISYIICHYSEIGLKGKNRKFFEEKLIENIKKALSPSFYKKVRRISGRVIIEVTEQGIKKQKEIKEKLKNVFGLAYFAFAQNCSQDIKAICKKAKELLENKKFKTFKISAKRSKKDYPLTSQEINERVGEYILKKFHAEVPLPAGSRREKIKVNLTKPDITLFIEIVERYAFLYSEKIKGPCGLPVGVSGKAISLISGGIDSPVASFFAMKRGLELAFLHFFSYPFTQKSSLEKVRKLVRVLNKFQGGSRLYFVPFADIQKEILLKTKAKLRVILYRRFMFRIAEEIARKESAKALITGESVGQVASQTLENIGVIEGVAKLPVLRPLIGMDKQDIIKKAREIDTFDISILPAEDCCSRFLPKHPETKAKLKEIKKEEEKLDVETLVKETLKKTKYETI